MVSIISYGTYIPVSRIRVAEIAGIWKKDATEITKGLGVTEKAVPAIDEDAVTIAIEAARKALELFPCKRSEIEALFVGSESHPYAVNPTATTVGELLGIGNNYLAADLEFACKAATAGIEVEAGLLESKQINYGLVIGADTAQSRPHDILEYTSAAAGVACVLGRKKGLAELLSYTSYSSDTPDFWRRDGMQYPSHHGRFTGEPAYFTHVMAGAKRLFARTKLSPEQIDYCVFHMPNGKFPRDVARRLGFTPAQLAASLTVDEIGNPYSASSLLGLAAVLDQARPDQTIFMVSYGSGAGSDAFLWKTTEELAKSQKLKVKIRGTVRDQIQNKNYIDYTQYLKQIHKI